MKEKALIAMSGGIDSSVAALLMKEAGYDCIGATMKLYTNEDLGLSKGHTCCSLDDVEDARSIAQTLGIPYYVFNFSERFAEDVIEKFVSCYERGMTPNPCIDCNRYLKFEKLFTRAKELDCRYIATGHYARVDRDPDTGRFLLKKALDPSKDQSYVLYALTQDQLSHICFPLGEMTKSEARLIAENHGFINAKKHDSQDICFVPDGNYSEFICRYTHKTYPEGDFIDTQGNVLGRHKGIIRYTIGQRKGLGLPMPYPVYVSAVDPVKNTVTLARNEELYSSVLTASDINLISVPEIGTPLRVRAKIRYRQEEQWATAEQTGPDTLRVTFDAPQRAITAGQAVVLYDGDTVVGGGTICKE